jgi:uncharacterized membrane protein
MYGWNVVVVVVVMVTTITAHLIFTLCMDSMRIPIHEFDLSVDDELSYPQTGRGKMDP